jgi:hypothetical protein
LPDNFRNTELHSAAEHPGTWPSKTNTYGLGRAAVIAATHRSKFTKIINVASTVYQLVIKTRFETVSAGILVFSWNHQGGYRLGGGMLPFWKCQLLEADEATSTYWSHKDAEENGERPVRLSIYMQKLALTKPKQVAPASEIADLLKWTKPFIFGTRMDAPEAELVWSQDLAARATILNAMDDLKEQDFMWRPRVENEVVLNLSV